MEVYPVMHRRGSLHGTWASESIISASDSHLKREAAFCFCFLLAGKQS